MKSKKIVIGVVGAASSGKGTIVDYIKDKYNGTHCRFSAPLDYILDRLYIPKTRPNQTAIAQSLITTFGEDILAKTLKNDSEQDENNLVVIEGIRRWGDVKLFNELPNFVMIYIEADIEKRHERAKARGEKADEANLSLDEFKKQNELPFEKLISKIGATAKYKISNDGTINELKDITDKIMQEILK